MPWFQSTPRLRGKANSLCRLLRQPCLEFQSTPRLRGKANRCRRILTTSALRFQSTPRLRGKANLELQLKIENISVSIHASPQRQGEPYRTGGVLSLIQFQSTPRLRGKANTQSSAHRLNIKSLCFNPRLASEARRTMPPLNVGNWRISFNPRLASEARRTRLPQASPLPFRVSIHASPQRQGERQRNQPARQA